MMKVNCTKNDNGLRWLRSLWPVSLAGLGVLLAAQTPAQSLVRLHEGATEPEGLGSSLEALGDLDGDGVTDYAAGSEYYTGPALESGRLEVFSGATGASLQVLLGSTMDEHFGTTVANLGDLNGDSVPDFAVGASNYKYPSLEYVNLYSGADYTVLHQWSSVTADDHFGSGVGSAGDVDGDGVMDIRISAPGDFASGSGGHYGKLYVYSGATYQLIWSIKGYFEGGPPVTGAVSLGDVNGDGYGDLVVSEYLYELSSGDQVGRLVWISGVDGSLLFSVLGNSNQATGYTMSRVPDMDGDGVTDVVVMSKSNPVVGVDYYVLRIRSGSSGQIISQSGGITTPLFGLGGMPDVTGDGVPNVMVREVGIPSAMQVRSAADFRLLYTVYGISDGEQSLGRSCYLGDVTGDGFADWAASAPLADTSIPYQGHVYVFSGADPLGTVFCSNAVPNSSGQVAWLTAAGPAELDQGWFSLRVQGLPANNFGLFLCSTEQTFMPGAGGSLGNLCLGGSIGRYNLPHEIQSWGASGQTGLGCRWNYLPQPNGGVSAMVGDTWNFQMWYREHGGNTNFSSGLAVTVQ